VTNLSTAVPASDRELVLTRIIAVPREKVFRAWTEPQLLKQWVAPLPYTTPVAELDVRPGGANLIVMRDPDGNDIPNRGVYLEVIKNEAVGLYRCLHKSVGTVGKAVHDRHPHVRE
jgi:uncharacterized protein YndB with AHSA1/START domain